jgi:hypothetical protein
MPIPVKKQNRDEYTQTKLSGDKRKSKQKRGKLARP